MFNYKIQLSTFTHKGVTRLYILGIIINTHFRVHTVYIWLRDMILSLDQYVYESIYTYIIIHNLNIILQPSGIQKLKRERKCRTIKAAI